MICVIRVCPHGTIWITELHLQKDEWFGLNVSICKNGETQMRIERGEARGVHSAEARRGGHQGGGHHGAPVGRGPNFPLGWLNTPWQGTTMPSHQMQFTNFLTYSNHGLSDLHFFPVCELLFKDDAISWGVNTTSAINDRAARGA